MLFSTSTLVSSLALIGLAASQVVVTVTNTVIVSLSVDQSRQFLIFRQVTTLTVTPKTTSTRTTYITVTGQAPAPVISSSSTNYITVTVTSSGGAASTTVPATCPLAEWAQCGGQGYTVNCAADPICGANSVCKYKDGESLSILFKMSLIADLVTLQFGTHTAATCQKWSTPRLLSTCKRIKDGKVVVQGRGYCTIDTELDP